jgi:hypothetical protein
MKSARKMVLVDYDKYMKLEKPLHELDTAPKPLHGLQNDIHNILHSDKTTDYDKQNQYLRQLNRFLYMNQHGRKKREDDLINDDEIKKIKNEILANSQIKKETLKYEPNPRSFMSYEDSEDDEFASIGGNSIERTIQRVIDIEPPYKPQSQSTPVLQIQPKESQQNISKQKYTSPKELYHNLRTRTIPKNFKNKSNAQKNFWTSYENINKSFD